MPTNGHLAPEGERWGLLGRALLGTGRVDEHTLPEGVHVASELSALACLPSACRPAELLHLFVAGWRVREDLPHRGRGGLGEWDPHLVGDVDVGHGMVRGCSVGAAGMQNLVGGV